MSILNRPYVGTWLPNRRKIIQYTPDALVYLNGDTGLSGCPTCHHRIDIQQFVTSVSVDAGVEPGASSSSITLSIPKHYGDSIFRDGNTLLRNGLEVHVYFRGYFPMTGMADPDAGDSVVGGSSGVNLADIPQYPYYPVFHGVVTSVSHEYSGGYYSASLTCAGMLHFWQYMVIASNGSFFGARPDNSGVRTNLRGHRFTGMSPFAIIYSLYRDTAGAAAGVGFALQSRSNMQSISTASGDSLYSMMLHYWERRFLQGMYRLRMHGASGQLFSGSTQAYLARLGGRDARFISVVDGSDRPERDILGSSAEAFNLIDRSSDGRIIRGADLRYLASSGGAGRDYGVVVPQMQAFVNDISQWGQVNFFETTYESKLDIATQVANVCGYEFYQDMDGDLVFKPPLYNLDTSSSRVYRIEPEDIISISFTENEPEATYSRVSAGPFQNMRGAVDESEFGVRAVYYDYRLIAQFGWREGSLESNYYSNARSAYYAAVAQLDRLNQGMNSASVTIPLRPELRPGFPVYIPNIDCFYYVQSVSHAFTFGSGCTTTLSLSARRRKFIPPGNPEIPGVAGITLAQTTNPPKSLRYLDNSNIPRVLGFPNVVMALDPERINPLFFYFGLDAEMDRSGPRTPVDVRRARQELLASNFAQLLVSRSILAVTSSSTRRGRGAVDEAPVGSDEVSAASLATAEVTSEAPITSPRDREDIIAGPWIIQTSDREGQEVRAEQLREGLQDLIRYRSSVRARIAALNNTINAAERAIRRRGLDAPASESDLTTIREARAEIAELDQFLRGEDASVIAAARAGSGIFEDRGNLSENGELVGFLIGLVRANDPTTANRDMSVDATGAINDSATILEMLGDRKAALGLNTPGYYRYYSSAHPNPSQQGYLSLSGESSTRTEGEDVGTPPDETSSSTPEGDNIFARERPEDIDAAFRDTDPEFAVEIDSGRARRSVGTGSSVEPTTVGVRDLTAEELGSESLVSPESLRDLVKLENITPVKGLNVRTFNSQIPTSTPTDQILALSFEQRVTTRVGRQTVIRPRGSTRRTIDGLRACLQPESPLGRALGDVYLRRVRGGTGGDTNAAETGGALVGRATGSITGLENGEGQPLTSDDVANGAVNSRAMLNTTDITSTAVGGPNTASNVETVVRAKANALIYQVSQANSAQIERAIDILRGASLVTTPVTPPEPEAPPPPPSESDSELAARVSRGHGRISPEVIRAIRLLESRGNANAIRFEPRLYREATGEEPPERRDGESARSWFNRVLAASDDREAVIRSTSFGYYQVLGRALIQLYPSDPVGAWDRDPDGVSGELLDRFLDNRPAVRRAMEAVSADPSEENINQLALVYNGAAIGTEKNDRWSARFTSGLRTGRTTGSSGGGGRGRGGSSGGTVSWDASTSRRVIGALRNWLDDIKLLFGSPNLPSSIPFVISLEEGVIYETLDNFSPVFPVSDALGYEHYGTYQYGRGLSIEPGGNYQTLMSTDPFQYVDPDDAYRFAEAVRRRGRVDDDEVRGVLQEIAGSEGFANSPGAEIAIRIFRESGGSSDGSTDPTTMIAAGLANYVMSDRDAITHLPVSNTAFRLTDLNPNMTGDDTCECRGAEADLLLAAYMQGANEATFTTVESPDEATQWVANQVTLAADSWVLAQQAMRGSAISGEGRRSVFDSVQGILGIASQATAPFNQLESDLAGVADPSSRNLRRLNELAGRVDRLT